MVFFLFFSFDSAYIVRILLKIMLCKDREGVIKYERRTKMSNQLIYTGKAKDIYTTEDEHVIGSVYKDQATMLNGARKETIEGKGCAQ